MHYTYVDLPSICAAWWSATDHNPADWIQSKQGGWLEGIVEFYLWYMRPGFAFTDINDQFRGNWESHDEYCQGLDMASYVTRNGYGRAWSQRWLGRFGPALYHPEYAHNLIFRDATLPQKPLTDLPRAKLFWSRQLRLRILPQRLAEGERSGCGHARFLSLRRSHERPWRSGGGRVPSLQIRPARRAQRPVLQV